MSLAQKLTFETVPSLTRNQLRLLRFIDSYKGEHGISPTYDEMREAMNLKSKSGIGRMVEGLIARGAIERPQAHCARSLTVIVNLPKPKEILELNAQDYPNLTVYARSKGLTFQQYVKETLGRNEAVILK